MRYVIKGRWASNSEYYVAKWVPAFYYTDSLEDAFHFISIGAAIDAIVARQIDIDVNKCYQSPDKFTIVGIREVSTPRYEEVIL